MSSLYFLYGSILEKCGFFWKNSRFFQADIAGLGKYCTGGYGRIGVYRVKQFFRYRVGLDNIPLFDDDIAFR